MGPFEGEREEKDFSWRVTAPGNGGDINIEFGTALSDHPAPDEVKIRLVGEALIKLGTRVIGGSLGRELDDDDYDDGGDD